MGGNSFPAFWVPIREDFLEAAGAQQGMKAVEGYLRQPSLPESPPGQGLLIWGTSRGIAAVRIPEDPILQARVEEREAGFEAQLCC